MENEIPGRLLLYLDSSDALMAHGPTVLHSFVADKLEAAMGKTMPQMEVRFKDLSISAKIFASTRSDPKAQLPTIYNSVKKTATKVNKDKYTAEKTILKNASGVFKPGTITLLLSQPGSGKSSLMKVLSGRFPLEKNVSVEGEITYNGERQEDLMKRLPQFVAYVTQRDTHFPTLIVKETLEFAHAFCGGGVSKRGEQLLSRGTPEATAEALDAIKALYAHYPEVVMKQLGLENCKDTIVGNGMLRGVSGGERKRVTTGEMEFGMKYMTLMDEISTGLDSAATFDIIKTQRSIAKKLQKTVVIALLQPAPEVFALFDDVMIMNEGEVIYHGPRDQVLGNFESLGFVCPPDRDVADFLLDLATDAQHKYEGVLPRGMAHFPRRASEFADIFRQSSIYADMLHRPELLTDVGTHMDTMPEFRRSFWENTRILMKRQTMVTMRNRAFIQGRTIMVIAMGLIYSSTFWQVDPTDVQVSLGIMFQAILFLALGQVSQVPTFMASRDVFYKQRGANFSPRRLIKKAEDDEVEVETAYALVKTPRNSTYTTVPATQEAFVLDVNMRHEKNFTPVTIAFQDLCGFAKPGTMTALMGSSGAGKTTLMDVIAGRKTGGTIKGKILFNGYEATDLAIRRCTGYCEQMDTHSDATTIREALTFSAFLRQDSSIPDSKKYATVNECLDLLGMNDIADQIVRGSSVEQMKRLMIGVELAAQPSVLFLDEPTSGLDARSAKVIMDGVRKVADTGRTVVCTIHQPSSDVFYLFDHLLLLKRGGETVFVGELGEKCHKLVEYFEAIPGVAPLPERYNPATWMLECIGAGVGKVMVNQTDFVQYFKESKEKRVLDAEMAEEGVTVPSSNLPEMLFKKKRAASSWTQAKFLTMRFMRMYWRTPTYNMTRFIIGILLALLFGPTYVDVEYVSYQGINGGVGMVFRTTLFNGIVSFNGVLPIASGERGAYYRERASQTYNSLWYFVGSTIAEIPYVFFGCLLFTAIFYPLVGFTGFGTAVLYWINISLLVLMQTYMGQLFVYALPSVEVSAIIGVLVNLIFFLFMGFNPPANSIPEGYQWLYTITPQKYSLSVLMALVFTDCPNEPTWNSTLGAYENVGSALACQPVTNLPVTIDHITVKGYVESVFEMKHDDIWSNFGYVFLCLAVLRFLTLLSLRYINHQKR
ncbi:unnamed protein product [Phytophthora fragariaefolia]|uniref:Unnamed protein product n=1 Tax=Phytophthora fragariaefolia TaxID=1490495 RepID=A0A9W7D3S9_9STRA|nr:unnamed protein product [Phytophthora fragariaefolia]